jgi:hypothetical protein
MTLNEDLKWEKITIDRYSNTVTKVDLKTLLVEDFVQVETFSGFVKWKKLFISI